MYTYNGWGRKVQTNLPLCDITYDYIENDLSKVHCNGATHTFDSASQENLRLSSLFTQEVLKRDPLGNILNLSTQNVLTSAI